MTISFFIISPQTSVATGEAVMVTAPGIEGEVGILENHASFATLLRAGCVIVQDQAGNKNYFYIQKGFLQANKKEVTILAEDVRPSAMLEEATIHKDINEKKESLSYLSDLKKILEVKNELTFLQAQLNVVKRARI